MKCRHFLSFVFVVSLAFFSGLFITTQNSFALADHVVVLDDSTSSSLYGSLLCGSGSDIMCNDYDYLIIESINTSTATSSTRFQLRIRPGNHYISYPSYFMSRFVFSLTDDIEFINLTNFLSLEAPFSYRITFTNSSPFDCPIPSGSLDISSNGTYDVSNYGQVVVDVPPEIIYGDYHNDLISINNSILVCGAILLVLYFFYCIYRLIIKNSGVH